MIAMAMKVSQSDVNGTLLIYKILEENFSLDYQKLPLKYYTITVNLSCFP